MHLMLVTAAYWECYAKKVNFKRCQSGRLLALGLGLQNFLEIWTCVHCCLIWLSPFPTEP